MDPLTKGSEDTELTRPAVAGTALVGMYAAMGALTGLVALPLVPDGLVKRVRGALVQDLCSRAGVTLTPDARAVFAEGEQELLSGALGQALRFAAVRWLRRLPPLGFLPPVRSAVTTFALGHLLGRYLSKHRTERATRMDGDEAKKVRRLIDRALVDVIKGDLAVPRDARKANEDLRDGITQVIDGVIIGVASLPDFVVRRLDAAFDAAVRREVG